MSEIREWLISTEKAINRWKRGNDPKNASLKLQWEFVQLDKQLDELKSNWRSGELMFELDNEKDFRASGLQELGKVKEVESIFEGQPPMHIFTIEATTYFQLSRDQIEILHKVAKPVNTQTKKN